MKEIQTGARLGHKVSIKKLVNAEGERTHPRYDWRASFVEGGKRKQKYFRTKVDAEKWKEKRESEAATHGTGYNLTHAERSTVEDTREELAAIGLTLREAVENAIERKRRELRSCTVAEMVTRGIKAREKAGLSEVHIKDLEQRLGRFRDSFGDRVVSTITKDEIEEWLNALEIANSTRNGYQRRLKSIFNDAIEDGYAESNPAAKVRTAKVVETETQILRPLEASALLEAADAQIVPVIAIGMFAGLRRSELKKLDWREVSLSGGKVIVKASSAKSAKARSVEISDNLRAWLLPHMKEHGPVWPANGRKLMEAARRDAGFGTPREVEKASKDGITIKKWPDNGLRHSFATYHLLAKKDSGALALEMGHTNAKIIFQHYRNVNANESEAAAFWSLEPESAANVVDIRKAS